MSWKVCANCGKGFNAATEPAVCPYCGHVSTLLGDLLTGLGKLFN